jgi:protein-L-isoaspartate(D-aspartate) O-methyltransferase
MIRRLGILLLILFIGLGSVTFAFFLAGCTQARPSPSPVTVMVVAGSATQTPDLYVKEREKMVDEDIRMRGIENPLVLDAMRVVPRHAFVLDEYLNQAYADHPLPIGYGQTISQPYIVALMSEALHVEAGSRVLEIGTGSGYQAAVLAQMGVEVYTVEIIPELAERARLKLQELGYTTTHVLNSDGYNGWEENAPYDAIIVTCAPDHLPPSLLSQLKKDGGRLVIPIGPVGDIQTLWLFEWQGDELKTTNLGDVVFVPLKHSP